MTTSSPNKYDHHLKTWPKYFEAIWDNKKRFEVRKTEDRTFEEGQFIRLLEWDPDTEVYTGRWIDTKVTYVTDVSDFALFPGTCCVFGFVVITRGDEEIEWIT